MEIPKTVLDAAQDAVIWGMKKDKTRSDVKRRLEKELAIRDVKRVSERMQEAALRQKRKEAGLTA